MKLLPLATILTLLCAATALAAEQPTSAPDQRAPGDLPKDLTLDCGNGVTMKLVLIPAGEFLMGTAEEYFTGCAANTSSAAVSGNANPLHWSPDKLKVPPQEKPQHQVRITKPFYMGIYLVTRAQYEALMGPHQSFHEGLYKRFNITNPAVESVTWYDAVEFCNRLSEKTGRQVRLPTEAEWEYAARAGTTTPWYTGDKVTVNQANCRPDWVDIDGTKQIPTEKVKDYYHPESVGKYPPNPWGLYDMIGNMWEWCLDWYDGDYYKHSPLADPTGPASGERKYLRGGGWDTWPGECRTALRHEAVPPDNKGYNWGFRVVCRADEVSYAPKKASWTGFNIQQRYYRQDEDTFGDLRAKYDFVADLPKTWTFSPDPKQEGEKEGWFKVAYYEVLGAPRDASEEVLKKAFEKAKLKYRPDGNPGDKEAEAKLKEVAEAYAVLSDPEQRKRYEHIDSAFWREIRIGYFWAEQSVNYAGDAWYGLLWNAPALEIPEKSKLYLWFGAVSETATVWVNGINVGSHERPPDHAWHDRFSVEVTGTIKLGARNKIVVKVHNGALPGGIWKSVKLAAAN